MLRAGWLSLHNTDVSISHWSWWMTAHPEVQVGYIWMNGHSVPGQFTSVNWWGSQGSDGTSLQNILAMEGSCKLKGFFSTLCWGNTEIFGKDEEGGKEQPGLFWTPFATNKSPTAFFCTLPCPWTQSSSQLDYSTADYLWFPSCEDRPWCVVFW